MEVLLLPVMHAPISLFLRPIVPVVLAALSGPLHAQVEWLREFPTEASFTATIEAVRAGSDDGLAALRGERRDEEHWIPVLMDGLSADRTAKPGEARHRLSSNEFLKKVYLNFNFYNAHEPDEKARAALEEDFLTLRGWMLNAAGDWDFHSTTNDAGTRFFRLERAGGDALINLVFRRGDKGWWSLGMVAAVPWVEPPPMPPRAPAEFRFSPIESGFGAVVEAMKAGAYTGLETLKGTPAPKRVSERSGGMPTWTIMPMSGLPADPEGDLHSMSSYGRTDRDNGITAARYALAFAQRPDETRKAQLEEDYRRLRAWLATHAEGWAIDETFDPYSWITAESRCFKLVPLPGQRVQRVDGEPIPRIELLLRKRPAGEPGDGEVWTLGLSCDAQGTPRGGTGDAPWVLEMLAESEPPQELPAVPDRLEATVLALIADAPAGFAGLCEAELRPEYDSSDHKQRLEDPIMPVWGPRRALTVHLTDAPDPAAVRDCVTTFEDRWRSEARASLGLVSVAVPNALTRHAVDARMDEIVDRLTARLDGWRVRVADIPGGKEDFNVRLATLDGLRPDGHPVWVQVERMSYPMRIPGHPVGDVLQLALHVSTDHTATVGEDLRARWAAALERGEEPLTSGVRVLGDPLNGGLLEGDLVVAPWGSPVELLSLLGSSGEDEVRLDVVRDGRYEELVISPPRLSLARWDEVRAEHRAGDLGDAALSLLGTRLELGEVVEQLRGIVEAGGQDFELLPPEAESRVRRSKVRELTTVSLPLWRAKSAPSTAFVETLRAGLATAFDGRWIVEPHTRNTGPFWDWFARQTHWSARHEGLSGLHPWVELAESIQGDEVVVALEVHAFSSAHRLANAEHPERLWFERIGGECVDGKGVAWCHREGLTFDGPFRGGVPDGTGRHLYADGKETIDVVYDQGDMVRMGRVPPPPPPVRFISKARSEYVGSFDDYIRESTWLSDWNGAFAALDVDPAYGSFLRTDYEFQEIAGVRRTCGACNGDGWVDTSAWVDQYEYTSTVTNTRLWMKGYDAIETYKGSHREYSSTKCETCFGTGSVHY